MTLFDPGDPVKCLTEARPWTLYAETQSLGVRVVHWWLRIPLRKSNSSSTKKHLGLYTVGIRYHLWHFMTMLGKPPVANFLRSFCWVFMDLGVYLNLELITNSCFLRSFVDNLTKECVCVYWSRNWAVMFWRCRKIFEPSINWGRFEYGTAKFTIPR